ncbi:MAG: HDOD domain-containing protein [Planctomycetota bacterium]
MACTRASFQDIVERVHTIPSLPEVVTQVVRMVNDPKSDGGTIGELMSKDAAMAAKILRLVNSVYFSLPDPVHSLGQAIMILGFKTVRSVALSISVINLFQQENIGFNMKSFWMHGCVSACICRLVAEKIGNVDADLAFIIGLLKDIGLVVMVEYAPEETRAVIAVAREHRISLQEAARKVIDTNHAEVGAWLCRQWGLEEEVIQTVDHQFDVAAAPHQRLVAIAQFSEYLCSLKRIRIAGDCGEPQLDQEVWKHLGLDKTDLVGVLAVINDEVDRAKELLALAS